MHASAAVSDLRRRPRFRFNPFLFTTLLVLILPFILGACGGGPPEAQMVASVTSGQAPLSVGFTNDSKNADEFRWDFGDGATTTTFTEEEPTTHEYTQAGTHTVTLIAVKEGEPPETSTLTLEVTVDPGPLSSVVLDTTQVTLTPGEDYAFSAEALDQFDNPIPGLSVSFQADDQAGQIDIEGTFTAGTTAGTYDTAVTVEAAEGEVTKTATADVTIKHGPLDRVLLSPGTIELDIGQTQQFSAEAIDAYNNPIPEVQLVWEIVGGVGTLSDEGLLTAGTQASTFDDGVKVTAVLDILSAEATVSVTVNPDPLDTIALAAIEIAAGESQQLEAVATDQYSNRLSDVVVAWRVLDENGGVITEAGVFTAGEVAMSFADAIEVEVTQDELVRTTTADVTIAPGPLEQVGIAPNPADIGIEITQQFVAVGADQYGNRLSGLAFTWSVEAGGGTIAAGGLFTAGTEAGTYNNTIKAAATQGDITHSATASVTVEPDRIAFISDRNGDLLDIYIMDANGTNVQRLTTSEGWLHKAFVVS